MPEREFERYDLKTLISLLGERFISINDVYVFGSRRYVTGSPRSDVDLLIRWSAPVRPAELREFSLERGPALDIFWSNAGMAMSCANESRVAADSFDELVTRLDAIHLWNRAAGFKEAIGFEWTFDIPLGVDFEYTVMKGKPFGWTWGWAESKKRYFKEIERERLPTSPYIGGSIMEIADFLEGLIRRLPALAPSPVGKARGVTIELRNEYDFQALFYACVKPWLPHLMREEMTLTFDGNKKIADFHLLENRVVIEMKYIWDTNSKNQVVKTLEGLEQFYKTNGNVRELILAIFVSEGVELDEHLWETEFGNWYEDVRVRVVVVRYALGSGPRLNEFRATPL